MATVTEIRKEIVEAIARGDDTGKLEKQLREARLAEETRKEVSELRAVADKRLEYQTQATTLEARAKAQGEAIDAFLALRDTLILPLAELITQAKTLPGLQSECYANFHDSFVFGSSIRQIPQGFLSEGFSCPRLDMAGGKVPSYEKAKEAIQYLMAGLGILQAFEVGKMTAFQAPAKEDMVVPHKIEPKSPAASSNQTAFQG